MARSRNRQPVSVALGTTEVSSLAGVFHIPQNWPTAQSTVLENALEDGVVQFIAEPTQRFRVNVISTKGGKAKLVADVITCPLHIEENAVAVIIASWKGSTATIRINGVTVGSTDFVGERPPAQFTVKSAPGGSQESPFEDFSTANAKRVTKRKAKYAGRTPKSTHIAGGADHLFAALKLEILQISDLLESIKNGNIYHIPGLSARLRLLIVAGEPLPLLQLCAAAYNVPLIVYTSPFPRLKIPLIPATAVSTYISAEPGIFGRNPVDLDVWLHFIAAHIGKKEFSNSTLLTDIGNTVGAHVDADIAPTVFMLRTSKVGNKTTPISIDLLGRYVETVAEAVLPLCRRVFEAHEKATAPNPRSPAA